MESFEKILKNCDVLESIFRYLDFKEHLKLIKICPQFEYAIVHGVWRLMCKHLCFSCRLLECKVCLRYKVGNFVNVESSLAPEAMHIILHHSSMYIHKLELILNRSHCLENIVSLKYHHLRELTLSDVFVEDTHLQQVAENCLNLQSFSLQGFTTIIQKPYIRANVFGKMKALNKLEINDSDFTAWNYFDVQQLFYLAQLKTLIINIDIRDSNYNNGNNNNSIDRVNKIENLRIEQLPCLQSANVCFIKDLIRFENLTKLSITSNHNDFSSFDDNDLTQISNGCPQLCELSFTKFYFKFNVFPRMDNLMHLTIIRCGELKFKQFDEIFRKLKSLKSLRLTRFVVREEDIFGYNFISNTLETLTIYDIFQSNFVRALCDGQHKFENVSKVMVFKIQVPHPQSPGLYFSHIFPNLKELILDSLYISSEDILYLEHLKVLKFYIFDDMSWSYLEILFKHPTLTHITIWPLLSEDFKRSSERLPICCEGLTTTLEHLSLPSVVYERYLSFWPSFRQRNKLLELKIVRF